jgi:phosphoglycolate phosphatase
VRYKNIIFDLDGTLIDSAPTILNTIDAVLADVGIQSFKKMDRSLVGPPLKEIFKEILGENQVNRLDSLVDKFKEIYDTEEYKDTRKFDGVESLLTNLSSMGCKLHIVTNKRSVPTNLLIQMYNWTSVFESVYSLDSFGQHVENKQSLIGKMLKDQSVEVSEACYIGDSVDDGKAAKANNLDFIMVEWGYGKNECEYKSASNPGQLLNHIIMS